MSVWTLAPESRSIWRVMNLSGREIRNVHVAIAGTMVAGHGRRDWDMHVEAVESGDWVHITGVGFASPDPADPEQQPRVRVTFDSEDGTGRLFETHHFLS